MTERDKKGNDGEEVGFVFIMILFFFFLGNIYPSFPGLKTLLLSHDSRVECVSML